jgi:hypothetical protein
MNLRLHRKHLFLRRKVGPFMIKVYDTSLEVLSKTIISDIDKKGQQNI